MGNCCTKCVNDNSVSGITFDDLGKCSYCNEYEGFEAQLNDYVHLKKLWDERITKYKSIGEYDAVVGISGGKDSTYVLYNLVKTYGLKVLAITVDNGFLNDWSKDRINAIVSELGVEHRYITYPKEILSSLYQSSIKAVGSPCIACSYMIYMGSVNLASELNIPMVIHGRSRAQMLKYFTTKTSADMVLPFLFSSLKHIDEVDLNQTYKDVFCEFNRIFPTEFMENLAPYFPDYKGKQLPEFVPYFLYHKYNEKEIVEFNEKNMTWRKPEGFEYMSHFDCEAHDAADYLYKIAEGRPHIMPELSEAVREGTFTREDAIKRLEENMNKSVPQRSLDFVSDYTGLSIETMKSMAGEVASRKKAIIIQ